MTQNSDEITLNELAARAQAASNAVASFIEKHNVDPLMTQEEADLHNDLAGAGLLLSSFAHNAQKLAWAERVPTTGAIQPLLTIPESGVFGVVIDGWFGTIFRMKTTDPSCPGETLYIDTLLAPDGRCVKEMDSAKPYDGWFAIEGPVAHPESILRHHIIKWTRAAQQGHAVSADNQVAAILSILEIE